MAAPQTFNTQSGSRMEMWGSTNFTELCTCSPKIHIYDSQLSVKFLFVLSGAREEQLESYQDLQLVALVVQPILISENRNLLMSPEDDLLFKCL